MDRRTFKRFPVGIGADLISDRNKFGSYIGNISACGMYLIVVHTEDTVGSKLSDEFQLRYKVHTGGTLYLHCRRRWLYTASPHSFMNRIGVEIIDPPFRYKEILYDIHKSALPRVKGIVTVQQELRVS